MNDLQISMVEDQLVWGNLHPDIWETILLFDTVPISDTTGFKSPHYGAPCRTPTIFAEIIFLPKFFFTRNFFSEFFLPKFSFDEIFPKCFAFFFHFFIFVAVIEKSSRLQ